MREPLPNSKWTKETLPVPKIDFKPFVFVHVPKTGGSSIIHALREAVGEENLRNFAGHCPAPSMIFRHGREWFDDQYTFGMIRNPWDRFYSLYNFCMQTHTDKNTPVEEWPFDRWTRAVLVDKVQEVMRIYRNIRPMEEWLFSEGEQVVDFIGRFERINEDWEIICEGLGIGFVPLPHANKTRSDGYLSAYASNPELVDIVGDFYQRDIDRFGYSLEGLASTQGRG